MIQITHLSKSYYGHRAVDNLSLNIPKGAIFGFLGPNGAGKTTAMKMIVGLTKPDQGKVEVEGHDLSDLKSREHIGFMPEDPYFYDHLSAIEFLSFMFSLFPSPQPSPRWRREGEKEKSSHRKVKGAKANHNISLSLSKGEGWGEKLLKMVGLEDVGKKKIKEFSKGMKQRLGLAQALVNNPNYLFLDEPLDGLDPIGRLEFKKIFLNLKKQGKTIFFNSHILSDVEEICDLIGIVSKGKLIYFGPVKKFSSGKSLEQKFVEVVLKNE